MVIKPVQLSGMNYFDGVLRLLRKKLFHPPWGKTLPLWEQDTASFEIERLQRRLHQFRDGPTVRSKFTIYGTIALRRGEIFEVNTKLAKSDSPFERFAIALDRRVLFVCKMQEDEIYWLLKKNGYDVLLNPQHKEE